MGGRALAVPTDVGDPAAVESLVARALDAYITGETISIDGGGLASGA